MKLGIIFDSEDEHVSLRSQVISNGNEEVMSGRVGRRFRPVGNFYWVADGFCMSSITLCASMIALGMEIGCSLLNSS